LTQIYASTWESYFVPVPKGKNYRSNTALQKRHGFAQSISAWLDSRTLFKIMDFNYLLNNSQFAAKRFNDFFYGLKLWRAVCRQGFVKILTAQICFLGDLAHTFGFGNIANGYHKQFAVPFFKGGLKILMDHLRAVQIFAGIPFFGGYFHRYLFQFVHNGSCFFDVFALGGFIATAKQKNYLSILDGVISSEAGAKEKTQLKQVSAKIFMVSKVTKLNVVKPADNPRPVLRILNSSQLLIKDICCINFVFHQYTVAHERQIVKSRLKHLDKRKWQKLRASN